MAFREIDYVEGDPREALIRFIKEVIDILHRMAARDVDIGEDRFPPEEILSAFRAALQRFIERGGLRAIMAELERLDSGPIEEHGLRDEELKFKLDAIKFAEQRYVAQPRWWPLRKLIDTFEPLLKSILSAVGTGGALDEIKETGRATYNVANS